MTDWLDWLKKKRAAVKTIQELHGLRFTYHTRLGVARVTVDGLPDHWSAYYDGRVYHCDGVQAELLGKFGTLKHAFRRCHSEARLARRNNRNIWSGLGWSPRMPDPDHSSFESALAELEAARRPRDNRAPCVFCGEPDWACICDAYDEDELWGDDDAFDEIPF